MAPVETNQYELKVPAGTEVSIEVISHGSFHQKVDVLISDDTNPGGARHVAFYGSGEGQRMLADGRQETVVLHGVENGKLANSRTLTFTFLYNAKRPSGWADYKPARQVRSYQSSNGGRVAPAKDQLWTEIIGSDDGSPHTDNNDSLVFVALYTRTNGPIDPP